MAWQRWCAGGGFSVCLGGDHYVGYPSCLGYTRAVSEMSPKPKIGYIHIDGHLDFRDDTPVWGKYNHGTNARRISELDLVSPSNMVWIGIQGWSDEEPINAIDSHGGLIFTAADVLRIGPGRSRPTRRRARRRRLRLHIYVRRHRLHRHWLLPSHRLRGQRRHHPRHHGYYPSRPLCLPNRRHGSRRGISRIDPSGRSMIMSTDLLLAHVAPASSTLRQWADSR